MESSPPPAPPRSRRLLRGLALALGLLAGTYAAALALVSRPAFETALRDRVERTLRARLGPVTVGEAVSVDPLFRISFGPVTLPGGRAADPPLLRIDRVKVRPRLRPLLAGRAEPASVRLYGVRISAGKGGRGLQDLATRLGSPGARRSPAERGARGAAPARQVAPLADGAGADAPVHLRDLVIVVPSGGAELEVGPFHGLIQRARGPGEERFDVALELPGGGAGHGSARRDGTGWRADLRVTDLGAEAIPAALRAGPAALVGGKVQLELRAHASPDLARADGSARLLVADALVAGERIGPTPLGPLSGTAEGSFTWDGVERRLTVRDGRVALLDAAEIGVAASVRVGSGLPFALSARADALDFAAVAAALPPALALPDDAPRPAGTLDLRLEVGGALLAPASWSIEAALDLSRMREAARRASPVALRAPFVHRPAGVKAGREIVVGPASPDFVPVAELEPHVIRAITASEDAGFFAHEGFDFDELRNAFVQGARAGRVVRGGSTISQQVAKNLFLSREKTVTRKIREALVTVALEATVPKARLLEIYLNVAEWGPGLHGIGPASRHWFGKDARELSPKEAAFLATVIPNPVRYHFMRTRGAITEGWEQKVNELLFRMLEQGSLSDEAFRAALVTPVVFSPPDSVRAP